MECSVDIPSYHLNLEGLEANQLIPRPSLLLNMLEVYFVKGACREQEEYLSVYLDQVGSLVMELEVYFVKGAWPEQEAYLAAYLEQMGSLVMELELVVYLVTEVEQEAYLDSEA